MLRKWCKWSSVSFAFIAGALVFASSAPAAAFEVGCAAQGTASFTPGLGSEKQPYEYTLTGILAGCRSTETNAPEGATIEAGDQLKMEVKNAITGEMNTATYQEPVPTAQGSCAEINATGILLTTWSDGTHTIIDYNAKGGLAAAVKGGVFREVTLTAVEAQEGDPSTITIKTNRLVPLSQVAGALAFLPGEPAACNTPAGFTRAGFTGALVIANPPAAPTAPAVP